MANYIKESLEEGEQIIYNGRLHWSAIFGYLFSSFLLAVGGVALIVLGFSMFPEQKNFLMYTSVLRKTKLKDERLISHECLIYRKLTMLEFS